MGRRQCGQCTPRPERAGLIRIDVGVGQIARSLLLFDEHAAARQQLHQPRDDLVQQHLQFLVGWRGYFDKHRLAARAPVHAVQHQAMEVNIEIGRRPKSLDQRDRAAVGLKGLEASLIKQVARDHAVHDLQHRRYQHRLCSQLAKRSGMGSDSTHWRTGTRGMT